MSGTDPVKSFDTLDVQIKALEGEVRDIKTNISSLAGEVRSALNSLAAQFAQQQRTPWVAIGSILSVVLAIAGFMAYQTVNPITADIKMMKESLVPRVEHDYRQGVTNDRFHEIDKHIAQIQDRRYEEILNELRELKRQGIAR